MIDGVEDECIRQIYTFVNHPAFTNRVAIMPDTHSGKGSVIGFTMRKSDTKVIPNVIGVDIGCGIRSIRFEIDKPIDLKEVDKNIRKSVPLGFNIHTSACAKVEDDMYFKELCKKIGANPSDVNRSIGTLGGGNHFIEIGKDLNDNYWLTIHTGSRNFGLKIANYYQTIAIGNAKIGRNNDYSNAIKNIVKDTPPQDRGAAIQKYRDEIGVGTPQDLAWLEGDIASEYMTAMYFAQEYAVLNRTTIMNLICASCGFHPIEQMESIHNYIDKKDRIIRKGAIRSYKHERMIIPFNMRDGALICEGKSNPEWNYSAPHGAGRVMSRSSAKKLLKIDEFKNQMNGIYSTSISNDTLDEAPDAYKSADLIEAAIEPTAKIVTRIKPIYNIKSGGES
jgi:tRNA-splicing ligase RtcB (3'-phosphate/5'-hydroxy nucleic acid ligase)